jgi:hypothetical protein
MLCRESEIFSDRVEHQYKSATDNYFVNILPSRSLLCRPCFELLHLRGKEPFKPSPPEIEGEPQDEQPVCQNCAKRCIHAVLA